MDTFFLVAAGIALLATLLAFAFIGYKIGRRDGISETLREVRRSRIPVELKDENLRREVRCAGPVARAEVALPLAVALLRLEYPSDPTTKDLEIK